VCVCVGGVGGSGEEVEGVDSLIWYYNN
jgi:hypothetical protein